MLAGPLKERGTLLESRWDTLRRLGGELLGLFEFEREEA
jgi:hypothetical protein